ncbi:hypothetical protein Z043_109403 [Scleropages formosus]|uniref:Uncharacterized protein n=1 Tax=Scleropages formosus TaxID=113540 RepID=A0A0P7YUV4_SCLFO|nr:hypothetical protein Z043_109403 [Scleropages formosus]
MCDVCNVLSQGQPHDVFAKKMQNVHPRQGSCSIRSPSEKLQGGDPEEKASRYLYPDVKEEPDVTADDTHPSRWFRITTGSVTAHSQCPQGLLSLASYRVSDDVTVHGRSAAMLTTLPLCFSCFLYKFDEGEAAGVSPGKADGQVSVEVLRTLLKRHYSQESASKEVRLKLSLADVGRTFRRASGHEHRPRLVTTEMCQGEETCAALLDEDTTLEEGRDGMVPEIVQLYHRQQEVLNATLQKHKQLEAVKTGVRDHELAAVRRGRAPVRSELLTEPETVHAEDSLKEPATVETERAQKCTCASAAQSLPEAHYAVQLSELRRRLDRAEEDREELQEALRQEREAREKLELVIAQLRQQLSDSHPVSGRAAPGAAAVWS